MTARDVPEGTLTIEVPGRPGGLTWRDRVHECARPAAAELRGPLMPRYSLRVAVFLDPADRDVPSFFGGVLLGLVAAGVLPSDYVRADFFRTEASLHTIARALPSDAPGGNEARTLIYLRTHAQELNW